MQMTRLHADTEGAAETIDAALFSGDEFQDGAARRELRQYLERWTRALNELDAFGEEESKALTASDGTGTLSGAVEGLREGEAAVELKPVREALGVLKVKAPANLLALRLASAFAGPVSRTLTSVSLTSFVDDMGYTEPEELGPLFKELANFHQYPVRDGVAMQASILSEYRLKDDLSCEFQFSTSFVSLVKTFS